MVSTSTKRAKAGFLLVSRENLQYPPGYFTALSKFTWASFSRYGRVISACFLISSTRVPHGKDYSRVCPGRHGSTFGLQNYLLFIGFHV